ncbi:hypothetical protein EVJ58_g4704 [Rhodofomes roseus]|uniref:Uncharacterized protein n=1 Tax=Rhodofomes roseus TaxID=34475 RepID=A0A4Y9YEY1_9APHY|nr:hypothetical protein EVJ58_g4704 [Rhodofomes roseus]
MSPPAITPQKRKAHHSQEAKPDASNAPRDSSEAPSDDSETRPPKNEYETGRVKCEGCGDEVSFRDEATGGFTLQLWEAHRLNCPSSSQPQIAHPLAQSAQAKQSADVSFDSEPQAKRRRSKRTEEERIEYLRSDPYVAQFEAYRVLCACCDKWIRLRPNSTYCSIPWDAHRKSCLAKKAKYFPGGAKTVCDDRGAIFAADPNVRKFDSERVLCRNCEGWVAIGVVNNEQAAKLWAGHRASCQRNVFYGQGSSGLVMSVAPNPALQNVPPPPKHLLALASSSSLPLPVPSPVNGAASSSSSSDSTTTPPTTSFKDYNSTNQESRRRTAEQRAAQLRADPLVGEVQPTRVFCTMCHKWVQLRQDSTYCSYPWEQHREKCLKRQYVHMAKEVAPFAEKLVYTGRLEYTLRAVTHLFSATYESTDELTIAALVTFLNAAMPPDKHEDFDTAEVTKAAMALQARGHFVLEGDVLRIRK